MSKTDMKPYEKMLGIDGMTTAMAERAAIDKRIYKAKSNEERRAEMRQDIALRRVMLQNVERCDLDNVEEVRDRCFLYLEACEKSGTFPSIMGLSTLALGYSRQNVNHYIRNHNNDTTHFLESMKELIADILTNAALSRQCDAVSAIFQLKNQAGFTDKLEIVPEFVDPLGDKTDSAALIQKYEDMPD